MKKWTKEEAITFIKQARARGDANALKWHSNVRARDAERRRQAQHVIYEKMAG